MEATFDTSDFITTYGYEEDGSFLIWKFTAILAAILIVMVCCSSTIRRKKDNVNWETLSDFNHIRSNFKSIESLKRYLSQQTASKDMVFSILFLIGAIMLNTYTNLRAFWHYREDEIFDDELLVYFAKTMSAIEIVLSFIIMVISIDSYLRKYYVHSIYLMIIHATNISALIFFTLYNIQMVAEAKRKICNTLESKKSIISQLIRILLWFVLVLFYLIIGVGIFVVKVNQISYIYDRDIWSLAFLDFIVVFGTIRQFSSLYSMCNNIYCWNFVFITLHPTRKKEMGHADPKWHEKFNVDEVVCREMIENYGKLWGYIWLCHTFSDLENVKKMYIEHHSHQGSLSVLDQAPYSRL